MRQISWKRATLVAATAFALLSVTASPSHAATLPTWPTNPNWQALVPGPTSDNVRAAAVVRTHGSVTNASALTGQTTGSTTMTVTQGGSPAIIVLDYGKEVGGTPNVSVSAASPTTNNVRIATSESLRFLTTNTSTTLAASASAGATNVKVASVTPFYVGSPITVDTGTATETRTVTSIGTAGSTGTGVRFTPALSRSHSSGRTVTGIGTYTNDNGSQINLAV